MPSVLSPTSQWERSFALTGILAVALLVPSFALIDPYDPAFDPDPTDGSAHLADAIVANKDPARLGAQLSLGGALALLWFVGYVYGRLRRAEGGTGWVSTVALGGGLVAVAVLLTGVGFAFAASELASYGDAPQVAKLFVLYNWNAASLLAPPMVALVMAVTFVGFRFRALPRWTNWAGIVVLALIGFATATNAAGLASGLGLLYLVPLSVALFLADGSAPHEPAATGPAVEGSP